MKKIILFIMVTSLLFGVEQATKEYLKAHEIYNNGDKVQGLKMLIEDCNKGACKSCSFASYILKKNESSAKRREGIELANKACAVYNCLSGCLTEADRSFKNENYFDALEGYKRACEENIDYACIRLGDMHRDGLGVRQNYSQAKEYYGLGCDNGDQYACGEYAKINKMKCAEK